MRYPLLSTQLYNAPLLLDLDKARLIEQVFRAHALGGELPSTDGVHVPNPQAVAYASERFKQKPYAVTEQGIAVIPVTGSMVHRGSSLDAMSGLTSYTRLEMLMDAAFADPDVRGILQEMDSPGGQAAGVFDLGQKWRAQAEQTGKPLWAVANEAALSGGYVLASSAQRLIMTRTARVGSIGVIALHVDQSKRDEKMGLRYTAIHAGAKKADGNPHEPLSKGARATMQSMVDSLYGEFVSYVATMRGLDADAVRAQEAGVFSAPDALAMRLADESMSFNDALSAFSAHVGKGGRAFSGGSVRLHSLKGESTMSNAEKTAADEQAAAELAAHVSSAKADGAKEMQARIQAIQSCDEAKGREKLASHLAFNTAMSADEAKGLLAASAKEAVEQATSQANALAAGMASVSNPNVGADAPAGDPALASSLWDRSNSKLHRVK